MVYIPPHDTLKSRHNQQTLMKCMAHTRFILLFDLLLSYMILQTHKSLLMVIQTAAAAGDASKVVLSCVSTMGWDILLSVSKYTVTQAFATSCEHLP